jgi:hypothetical protein
VSTTTPDRAAETPKRAAIAAAVALGAHVVILLATSITGSAATFLGGEALIGLAAVVVSALQFRRGWRYTGVGLMGGWLAGLFLIVLVQALA